MDEMGEACGTYREEKWIQGFDGEDWRKQAIGKT